MQLSTEMFFALFGIVIVVATVWFIGAPALTKSGPRNITKSVILGLSKAQHGRTEPLNPLKSAKERLRITRPSPRSGHFIGQAHAP